VYAAPGARCQAESGTGPPPFGRIGRIPRDKIAEIWAKIQTDFGHLTFDQQLSGCTRILIPLKMGSVGIPTSVDELKKMAQSFADIDSWDTLPLFQGASKWLRRPPVFDPATGGPCATPSSSDPLNSDPFADGHEDPKTCSNTVAVAGQCWLNGTVNYGTFGVMVRLCSDLTKTPRFIFDPSLSTAEKAVLFFAFSLDWAKTLIRTYKRFGQHPEGAIDPIRWTEATFNGGPKGVPKGPGNRPNCKCACGCKADIVKWDYVWEPFKPRSKAIWP
jgi:hypothetical protein